MPSVVGFATEGQFCPRRAVVTKARPLAKTMSRGSSQVCSVRVTRDSSGVSASTVTMLMLSERWFTTHTSVSVRAATATGSSPTGTSAASVSPPASTS